MINAKDLMTPFADYLMDKYKDAEVFDDSDFIEDFFKDPAMSISLDNFKGTVGTSTLDLFKETLPKYGFPKNISLIDQIFFIKYFFNDCGIDLDLVEFGPNLPMELREDLNYRWVEDDSYTKSHKGTIFFDKLNLSKKELQLPSLILLNGNIPTIDNDPEDTIIVNAAYAPMYYCAYTNTNLEQFLDYMGSDDEEEATDEYHNLHNYLINHNLKVTLTKSDEVSISGKRSELNQFVDVCSNFRMPEGFCLEPFASWSSCYYEDAISSPLFAREFWAWKSLI